jgi:hypothetical protein
MIYFTEALGTRHRLSAAAASVRELNGGGVTSGSSVTPTS